MTPAQLTKFQKQLEELLNELSGKGPDRISPNRASEEEVGGDEDEQPLNEMLQSIASNRNRVNQGVLARVEKALAKLKERPDDFGECEECNEDIAQGRLKAMPYAEYCVNCQSNRDGPKGPATRRKLTDYR